MAIIKISIKRHQTTISIHFNSEGKVVSVSGWPSGCFGEGWGERERERGGSTN